MFMAAELPQPAKAAAKAAMKINGRRRRMEIIGRSSIQMAALYPHIKAGHRNPTWEASRDAGVDPTGGDAPLGMDDRGPPERILP